MGNYQAPGVYVEEVPSAVKPIAGVGTSTAGFIGVAEKVKLPELKTIAAADLDVSAIETSTFDINNHIPASGFIAPGDTPIRITNWEQFKGNFGDIDTGNNTLAHAVYGFFNNGGTACWISRVITTEVPTGQTGTHEKALDGLITKILELKQDVADSVQQLKMLKKSGSTDTTAIAQLEADLNVGDSTSSVGKLNTEIANYLAIVDHATDTFDIYATYTAADWTRALAAFEKVDEIAIVAAPGVIDTPNGDTVVGEVLTHCINMGDRFAIIDGKQLSGETSIEVSDICPGVSQTAGGYGAVYFPWIKVYDPCTDSKKFVPPSGHLAGIYARSDSERGVHKAPANEVVRGALDIEYLFSRADQQPFNVAGVNIIRSFNGNITVWGARTWTHNAEWNYISTRRLFNFIKESIEDGTRWVVFEPNDLGLWAKIRRNINAFLTNVWRDGALFGATPEEAFYVKCDAELNPPEIRDLGQVVIEIGLSVVKPAEFVIFRISQWQGS